MTERKKVYINIDQLLQDEKSIIKYCSSDRSDGKTTLIIELAYETWLTTGKIGVISRRWSNDITTLWVNTLFTNLQKIQALKGQPVGDLKAKGSPKKSGVHLFADGKEFAVCVPLSRADSIKSAFDVATHKNLYIDEYIPLNGRYVKDEVDAILEIFRTIDRDTWTNFILIMSNHIAAICPLFSYFDVQPRDGISRWKNGRLCMLQVANKGNREQVNQSPLGELVAGTPYGAYAAGGYIKDNSLYIQPTHTNEILNFCLRAEDGQIYCFYRTDHADVVIDVPKKNIKISDLLLLTLQKNGGHDGGTHIKYMTEIVRFLKNFYYTSHLFCASEKIYYNLAKLWQLLK